MRRILQMLEERPNPVNLQLRKLWGAVMIQAIDDLKGVTDWADKNSVHIKGMRYQSALNWFMSTNTSFGTFHWVCDLLMMDPGKIRDRLFHESASTGQASKKTMDRRQHPLLTLR